MCGINGIFAYHYAANPIDRRELLCTRDYMENRGPDGAGAWIADDGRIGFGHRRLSIIDLSDAAAQPMVSDDGSLVVTFNGEIYNYQELRKQLESRGRIFRTQSDTEILLQLYADKGEDMLSDLKGMFAFVIWDAKRQKLFFARDPYGIKPLYYANDGWTIRFASQVKALLAGGSVSREPEPAGWAGYYLLGSVPEPFTTYLQIRSLPAGHSMIVTGLGPTVPKRYFSIAQIYAGAESRSATPSLLPTSAAANEAVADALLQAVRRHLVADVPVGAFLSAGIDSATLVGLMREAGQADIQTVTLSFGEFVGGVDDEAPIAEAVARHYQTRHTTRVVSEKEFLHDLPLIMDAMDQPTIDGLNIWFVSKAARELGLKVAISGLGGDELFGGYPSFASLPRWVNWLKVPSRVPFLGRAARLALSSMDWPKFGINPKFSAAIEFGGSYAGAYLLRRGLFMPWELGQVLSPDMVRDGLSRLAPLELIDAELQPQPKCAFAKVAALESSLYMRNQLLRDTDWASMAHALEVRVPLVDSQLLADVAPWTVRGFAKPGKSLLANSLKHPLPEAVTSRAKTGFKTPISRWQQNGVDRLRPYSDVPQLAAPHCAWSRRWAYSVASA